MIRRVLTPLAALQAAEWDVLTYALSQTELVA